MSDLYLELRSKIAVVAQKTYLGTQRIQEAQDISGLSNETIAHAVPVSEKTWRRWKLAGTVPTAALPAVAKVLGLELKELDPASSGERIERLAAELRATQQSLAILPELQASLARIEALLLDGEDPAQSGQERAAQRQVD